MQFIPLPPPLLELNTYDFLSDKNENNVVRKNSAGLKF